MRLEEIASAYQTLKELSEAVVPIQVAVMFKKNREALKAASEVFHERRHELFKELGKDENGLITVTDENMPEYTERNQEILDTEIPVEVHQFTITSLGEKLEISERQLTDIDCLLLDE